MSVTRIHSLAHPLPVKMGRTETSLTSLLFAAAYFSSVMVKVNAVFLASVSKISCVAFPSTHQLFSPSYQVLLSKMHTADMPRTLFLVDRSCWLLFSLTVAKSFQ